jgi:hypothetical protein
MQGSIWPYLLTNIQTSLDFDPSPQFSAFDIPSTFKMAALSTRAATNIEVDEIKRLMYAVFSDYYSESNPNGIFMMGIAENTLMYVLQIAFPV